MADLDHQDGELLVLNVADDAVITDLVTPKAAKRIALERCAQFTRIFVRRKTLVEKLADAIADDGIEFSGLLLCMC